MSEGEGGAAVSVIGSSGWARPMRRITDGPEAVHSYYDVVGKGPGATRGFSLTPTIRVVRFMGLFPNVYGASNLGAPQPTFGCRDAL